jgi:PAT family beta-lactamase induction signal transducer AmpG
MASSRWLSVVQDRRFIVLLLLGFSSGLPLMLTSRAMKVWAANAGVELPTVGLFSLVALPYALKFLWAPIMDWWPGGNDQDSGALGRRRGWLLVTQLATLLAIVGMAMVGPASSQATLTSFAALAVLVAFCSASQDIVADAYRTDILRPDELGIGASLFTIGYRLAMIASGAGAVFLAHHLRWPVVYQIVAAGLIIGVIATLLAPEPDTDRAASPSLVDAVVEPWREFISRNGAKALLILVFIVLFKLPDYLATSITDAMLVQLGFSNEDIGLWALGVGTAVTIPGAALGGLIVTWLGLRRALLIIGIAQAISNAGYLWLVQVGADRPTMIVVIGIEYFCTGLVAAAFIAFLMSQCNHRYSASQYALLSSLMGLASSVGGATAGYLAHWLGYSQFFLFTILISVPGLLLIRWLSLPATSSAAAPTE